MSNDEIEPLNIRTHSMISGDYDKQRILRLNNPINGAKIELTRFETRSDSTQTMPRKLNFFCHYDFRKFRLKSV